MSEIVEALSDEALSKERVLMNGQDMAYHTCTAEELKECL
jgi:hypothetical protein